MSTVEKKPYIHLSIDDTFEIFKDLAQNAMYYSSTVSYTHLACFFGILCKWAAAFG